MKHKSAKKPAVPAGGEVFLEQSERTAENRRLDMKFRQENNPAIVAMESFPNVDLIVTNNEGEILGIIGGENPGLAKILTLAHQLPGFPVKKKESMMALGQDCYEAEREFVMAIRGAFIGSSWEEIQQLERLPSGAKYTLVITI